MNLKCFLCSNQKSGATNSYIGLLTIVRYNSMDHFCAKFTVVRIPTVKFSKICPISTFVNVKMYKIVQSLSVNSFVVSMLNFTFIASIIN